MNSEEGTGMAKMAVNILLVVLVIGAVVGLVYAAYNWFGSGTDKLSDNVTSIGDSDMSQYDDQAVDGSAVISALKNYRNSDYSIFIANLKTQNNKFDATKAAIADCPVYCALPEGTAEANDIYTIQLNYEEVPGGVGKQYYFNGFDYADDEISIKKNTNFSPTTTKSSATTFVRTNAQWYANLVYDFTTGDVAGIVFRQMN